MINNTLYNNNERSPKLIAPNSPQPRRKNLEFSNNGTANNVSNNNQYSRKDGGTIPLSPHAHYYPQKLQNGKSNEISTDKDYSIESMVRQLSDRVIKMSQKVAQHENVLIKLTQNSLENNKEEYKKNNVSNKGDMAKITENINENINKLKKEFQDYKMGNIAMKEIQVKNQLFSELIHKSQERMKEEMQSMFRKLSQISSRTSGGSIGSMGSMNFDDKLQEVDRTVKKLQKNVMINTNKILGAFQKIESINQGIEGHMDLINAEVNKAVSKIVTFVNQKVSKPINENIARLNQKMQKIQNESKQPSHFGDFKSSQIRSQKQATKAQYRQILTAYGQQITISQNLYYIDIDGYLLDRNYYYLVDSKQDRIRLDQQQIKLLMNQHIIQ